MDQATQHAVKRAAALEMIGQTEGLEAVLRRLPARAKSLTNPKQIPYNSLPVALTIYAGEFSWEWYDHKEEFIRLLAAMVDQAMPRVYPELDYIREELDKLVRKFPDQPRCQTCGDYRCPGCEDADLREEPHFSVSD